MALLCFGPKKVHLFCSCDPLIKFFPIFALDPIRPYLDWTLRGFLTSLPIYDPFKFNLKWRPKYKIRLKCQFAIVLLTTKKIWNVPLDALICPLQIINWHWTPIIDPSWCKCTLYPSPIQCPNYSIGHKSETDQPKKNLIWRIYFYTFLSILGSKFKIPITTDIS